MVEMPIELFTSAGCVNCRKLKKLLPQTLAKNGVSIKDVIERDVCDATVLADLLMLGVDTIPTLRIGDSIITGEDAANEAKLNAFLKENLKK